MECGESDIYLKETVYRVLLVDHDPDDAAQIARTLDNSGVKFVLDHALSVDDYYEGLELGDYDILLMGINLDGIDGFEILNRIKRRAIYTPVIVITSKSEIDKVVEAMSLGASDYVTKTPGNIGKLPWTIEKVISEYSSRLRGDVAMKNRRIKLYKDRDVQRFFKALIESDKPEIATIQQSNSYHLPALMRDLQFSEDQVDEVLRRLVNHRVLVRTPIGHKITCPHCRSDDVRTVANGPVCLNPVFKAITPLRESSGPSYYSGFRCEGGCGNNFQKFNISFVCRMCEALFEQGEIIFEREYSYNISEHLRDEIINALTKLEALDKILTPEQTKELQENKII